MTEKFGKKLTRYALQLSGIVFIGSILMSFAGGGWGILGVILAPLTPIFLIQKIFTQDPTAWIPLAKLWVAIMVIVELFTAFLITRYIESKDGPLSAKDSFLSALFWLFFIGIIVPFIATPFLFSFIY